MCVAHNCLYACEFHSGDGTCRPQSCFVCTRVKKLRNVRGGDRFEIILIFALIARSSFTRSFSGTSCTALPLQTIRAAVPLQLATVDFFHEMLNLCTTSGSALLVLVPASFLVDFLFDRTSGIWANNTTLFMGIWFLYNLFGVNLIERVLSRYGVMYEGMNSAIKRQDACS